MESDSYVDDFDSILKEISNDDFNSLNQSSPNDPQTPQSANPTTPSNIQSQSQSMNQDELSSDFECVVSNPELHDQLDNTSSDNLPSPTIHGPMIAGMPIKNGQEENSKEYSVLYSTNQQPSCIRTASETYDLPQESETYESPQQSETNLTSTTLTTSPQSNHSSQHSTNQPTNITHIQIQRTGTMSMIDTETAQNTNQNSSKRTKHPIKPLRTVNSSLNHGITIASHGLSVPFVNAMALSNITAIHYRGTVTCVVGDQTMRSYLHIIAGHIKSTIQGKLTYNSTSIERMVENGVIDNYIGYYDPTSVNPMFIGSVYNMLMCYQNKFNQPSLEYIFQLLPTSKQEWFSQRFTIEYMISLLSFSFSSPRFNAILEEQALYLQQIRDGDGTTIKKHYHTTKSNQNHLSFSDTDEVHHIIKLLKQTHVESLNAEDIYLLTIIGFILARYPIIILQPPPSTISMHNMEQILSLLRDYCSLNQATIIFGLNSTLSVKSIVSINHVLLLHHGAVCFQGPTHDIVSFIDTSGFYVPQSVDVFNYLQLLISDPKICAEAALLHHEQQVVEDAQKQVQFSLHVDVPLTPQQIEDEKLTTRNLQELELISPFPSGHHLRRSTKMIRGTTMLNLLVDEDGNPLPHNLIATTGPNGEVQYKKDGKIVNIDDIKQLRHGDDDYDVSMTKNNYSKMNVKNTKSGFVVITDKNDGWDLDSDHDEDDDEYYDHIHLQNNNNNTSTIDPTKVHDDLTDHVAVDMNNSSQHTNGDRNVYKGSKVHRNVNINNTHNNNNAADELLEMQLSILMNPITYHNFTSDQEQYFIANKNLPLFRATQRQYDNYVNKYRKNLPLTLQELLKNKIIIPTSWGYLAKPKLRCKTLEMMSSYYKQSVFFNVIESDSCIYNALPPPIKLPLPKLLQEPCQLSFDVFSSTFLQLCIHSMGLVPSTFFHRVQPAVSTPKPLEVNTSNPSLNQIKLSLTPPTPTKTIVPKQHESDNDNDSNDDSDDDDDKDEENNDVVADMPQLDGPPTLSPQSSVSVFFNQIEIPTEHLNASQSNNDLIQNTPLHPQPLDKKQQKTAKNERKRLEKEAKRNAKKKNNNSNKDDNNTNKSNELEMAPMAIHGDDANDVIGGELAVIMDVDDDDEKPIEPYQPKLITPDGEIDDNNDHDDDIDNEFSRVSRYSLYHSIASEYSRIDKDDSIFHDMSITRTGNDMEHIDKDGDVINDDHFNPVSYTHVRYSKMYKNLHVKSTPYEDDDDERYMTDKTIGGTEMSHVMVRTPDADDDAINIDVHDSSDDDENQSPNYIHQDGLDDDDIQSGFNMMRKPIQKENVRNNNNNQIGQNDNNNSSDGINNGGKKSVTIDAHPDNGDENNNIKHNKNKNKYNNNNSSSSTSSKYDRFALPHRKQHFFQWRLWASTALNMMSSDYSITMQTLLALCLCGVGFAFFSPITYKRTIDPIPDPIVGPISDENAQLHLGLLFYMVLCMVFVNFFSIPSYFKQHRHIYSCRRPVYTAFWTNLLLEQILSILWAAIIGTLIIPVTLWRNSDTDGYTLNCVAIMLALYVLNLFIISVNRFISSFIPFLSTSLLTIVYILFHFCFLMVGAWWVPLPWLSSWLKWTRYSSPYNWIYYAILYKEFSYRDYTNTLPYIRTHVINLYEFSSLPGWSTTLMNSWYLIGIIWTIAASILFFGLYFWFVFTHYSKTINTTDLYDNVFIRQQKTSAMMLRSLNADSYRRGGASGKNYTEVDIQPLLHNVLNISKTQDIIDKSSGILRSFLKVFSYEPVMIAYKNVTLLQQPFIPTPDVLNELDNLAPLDTTKPRLKNINLYAQPGSVTLLTSPSALVPTHLPLDVLSHGNTHIVHGDITIRLQNIAPTDGLPSNRCHYTLIDGTTSSLNFPTSFTVQDALNMYMKLYLSHVIEPLDKQTVLNEIITLCDLTTFLHCKVRPLPVYSDEDSVYANSDEYLTPEQYLLIQLALGLLTGSTLFLLNDPFHYVNSNPHFIIAFMTLLRRIAAYSYTSLPLSQRTQTNTSLPQTSLEQYEQFAKSFHKRQGFQFRYTFLIAQNGRVLPTPALHMCDRIAIWTPTCQLCYFGDVGKRAKIFVKHLEKFPSIHHFPSTMNPLTFLFDLLQTGYAQQLDFTSPPTSHILPTTPNNIIFTHPHLNNYVVAPSDILKYRRTSNGFNIASQQKSITESRQLTFLVPNIITSGGTATIDIENQLLSNPNNEPTLTTTIAPPFYNSIITHRHGIIDVNDDMVRFYHSSVHFERCMRHINKIIDYNHIPSILGTKTKSTQISETKKYLTIDDYRVSNNYERKPIARTHIMTLFIHFFTTLLPTKLFTATIQTFIPALLLSILFGLLYLTFGSKQQFPPDAKYLYPNTFENLPYFTVQFLLPLILSSTLIVIYLHDSLLRNLSLLHITTTNPMRFPQQPSKILSKFDLFAQWRRIKISTYQSNAILPFIIGTIMTDMFVIIPIVSILSLIPFYAIVQYSWQASLFFSYLLIIYVTTLSSYASILFLTLLTLYFTRNIKSIQVKHTLSSLIPRVISALYILISMLFGGAFTALTAHVNLYIGMQYISLVIPFARAIESGYTLLIPTTSLMQYYRSAPQPNAELQLYDALHTTVFYFWVNILIIIGWTILFTFSAILVIVTTKRKPNHTFHYPDIGRYY